MPTVRMLQWFRHFFVVFILASYSSVLHTQSFNQSFLQIIIIPPKTFFFVINACHHSYSRLPFLHFTFWLKITDIEIRWFHCTQFRYKVTCFIDAKPIYIHSGQSSFFHTWYAAMSESLNTHGGVFSQYSLDLTCKK